MLKKNIAIIGGGASALMLACELNSAKFNITIYEKNTALGRKFLVAGKGGFNLTHSEDINLFANRYAPSEFIEPFFNQFTNTDFRNWLTEIGIETYIGSSKRVFPIKGIKPIEVLKAIELKLKNNKVDIQYNHTLINFDGKNSEFKANNESVIIKADIIVFALGGASWQVTGSDGNWKSVFEKNNIIVTNFYPSNCAYKINWDSKLINLIEGVALKNCTFTCNKMSKKGEAVLTQFGIEGSGIYALSKEIRTSLIKDKIAIIEIDFKPDLSHDEILNRLKFNAHLTMKDCLEKKINLTATHIQLLKSITTKEEYHNPDYIAVLIKSFPLTIIDFADIGEAISTVGGIALSEVTPDLELKKLPNHYCIGEMLDWDAPTGGYLLQACVSMGYSLAKIINLTI